MTSPKYIPTIPTGLKTLVGDLRRADVEIRHGDQSDIPWLMEQLRHFSSAFPSQKPMLGDEEHAQNTLQDLLQNHLLLLATKHEESLGFIAGFVLLHPFNPKIKMLTEAFWWVPTTERPSKAAMLLLEAYIAWGREHCDWVTMSLQKETKVRERSLTRRGFLPREHVYLMECD